MKKDCAAAEAASFLLRDSGLSEWQVGNCTTTLPMKFEFDPKGNGHTFIIASTRSGMSVDYSDLELTDAEVAEIKIKD